MSDDLDDVPDLLISDDQEAGPSRIQDRPKVPITLLTGYLGAGKSTLLDYVMSADHGHRIAVCMNDFGDTTDIEAKSLTFSDPTTQSQTTSFLSLPNGCLCCSFKDMGIAAIEEMVAAQKGGVDWVMVELTGVADPGPIARNFWSNEEMGDLILDGVVCVVDCRNVLKQLAEEKGAGEVNECQRQVACSDVILLNKTDLVSSDQLEAVRARIRQVNPTLRVHETVQSRTPLDSLFNLRAFSSDSGSMSILADAPTDEREHSSGDHDHDHDHDHHDHLEPKASGGHHSGVTTTLIPLPPLTADQLSRLTSFLESVLWSGTVPTLPGEPPKTQLAAEILRTKGYIPLEDGREYVLQGVTDIFELKEAKPQSGQQNMNIGGKVVFIGKGVNDELQAALLHYLELQ